MSLDKLHALRRPVTGSAQAPMAESLGEGTASGAALSGVESRARSRVEAVRDRLLGSRILLPGLLLAGFAGVFALLFSDRLLPAVEVEVASVVALRDRDNGASATAVDAADSAGSESGPDSEAVSADTAEAGGSATVGGGDDSTIDLPPPRGGLLFQASGWVEPDPLPIKATALVGGVVDEVRVLEGERVERGEILATLIREDAELDLREAERARELIQAECDAHLARIPAVEAEIEAKRREVDLERANLAEFDDLIDRFRNVKEGSVSEREVRQAALKREGQAAKVAAVEAELPRLAAELEQLRIMEATFLRRLEQADVEVARRRLALDRTEVKAPVDGVVLRLLAVPGQKKMLNMDETDSATVAILYQPDHLQIRVDVPLAEAAGLFVGQPARITSDLLPDAEFDGVVTRIVGEADLARNTLQAKVRLIAPDERLRPDMLCRVKFFALAESAAPRQASSRSKTFAESAIDSARKPEQGRLTIYAPSAGIHERQGDSAVAWVVGSGSRAERRILTLQRAPERDGHLAVESGLRPGDRVIVSPHANIAAGTRVRIVPTESRHVL